MRRLFLVVTLIAGLALVPAAASAATAQPTLAVQEDCPVQFGQQIYGVQATFTGLPPNTISIFSFSFGDIAGDADVVSSDEHGLLVRRVGFAERVRFIAVTLAPLFPPDAIAPLSARVKKPCKHAAKRFDRD